MTETVYDTPSGMGGSFNVTICAEDGDRVQVRIWYGRATETGWQSWPEFDGHTFWTDRAKLRNPRPLVTAKRGTSYYDAA